MKIEVVKRLRVPIGERVEEMTYESARELWDALGVVLCKTAPDQKSMRIKQAVASEFGVTVEAIESEKRSDRIAWARHVCFWIETKLTDKSQEEIAAMHVRSSGKARNHSGVSYGVQNVEERMGMEPETRERVHRVLTLLQGEETKV